MKLLLVLLVDWFQLKITYSFIKVINQVISSCSIPIRFFIVGDGEEKENIIENIKKFKIDYSTDEKLLPFN